MWPTCSRGMCRMLKRISGSALAMFLKWLFTVFIPFQSIGRLAWFLALQWSLSNVMYRDMSQRNVSRVPLFLWSTECINIFMCKVYHNTTWSNGKTKGSFCSLRDLLSLILHSTHSFPCLLTYPVVHSFISFHIPNHIVISFCITHSYHQIVLSTCSPSFLANLQVISNLHFFHSAILLIYF